METLEAICRESARGIPGCRVLPGGSLRFTRRGFEALVDFPEGMTSVWFDMPGFTRESLQVATAGLWHDVRNLLGWRDLEIGSPEFDPLFDLRSSDPGLARQILVPEIRSILTSLSRSARFHWRVSRAGSSLRVQGLPEKVTTLDGWLVAAFQLLDALPGAESAEQLRVTAEEWVVSEESKCQVCGVSLATGAVVQCRKCSTPHHRDCWEFNGRCSTFACGEPRFRI